MTDRAADERRTAYTLPLFLMGQIVGILLGRMADAPWLAAAALALSLAAFLLLRGKGKLAALTLLACAIGAVTGWYAYHPAQPDPGDYVISGVVCDEVTQNDVDQIKTRLCRVTLDGRPITTDAYWSFYADEIPAGLLPGCRVSFLGSVYAPSDATAPGGFSFREYLLGHGISCAVYGWEELTCAPAEAFSLQGCLAFLRHTLLEKLSAIMSPKTADYAAAMLLGVKQRIPQDDQAAFSRLGVAHVLVVSGFHVGVLIKLMSLLLYGRSLRLRIALTAVVCLGYALLAGGHTPVIRALLLFLLGSVGKLLKRPRPLMWTLCAAASVTLLCAPAQLTSASFQLTYAAVLGIALITPRLRRLGDLPAATLGAQLGVLLPLLYYFHEAPLLGLLLNILLLPAASGLIALYWAVLVSLPIAPVAQALGRVADCLTTLMTGTIRSLNQLPAVSLWTCQANPLTLLAWLAMVLLLSPFVRPAGRRRLLPALCVAVMLLSVMPLPHQAAEYLQFSNGSADAALLWDENCVVVVDAGEDGRSLCNFLHQRRLSVDTLILTHLHDDHIAGVQALLEARIPIGQVCLPWGAAATEATPAALAALEALQSRGILMRTLARGDTISLPSGEITVLWPEAGRVRPGTNPNNASLALHARVEGVSLLLMGDLTGPRAHYVATPADVLKAAHHGAADDNPASFLTAVNPKVILVSCGRNNELTTLRDRAGQSTVYDTCTHGTIRLTLSSGAYSIDTMKE